MQFDLQPVLANDLLILRPLREEDFEDLFKVASDPLIWEQHPMKERSQRNEFEIFFREAMESKGAFVIMDQKTGEIIGTTRFHPVKETINAIEIGWTFLARKYWGGEFNKSMKQLLMDYAFNYVDDIILYVNENNIRSQKAVEKIGGKRIKALGSLHLETRPNSTVIFRINKTQWVPIL